jgi:hypothetical protein
VSYATDGSRHEWSCTNQGRVVYACCVLGSATEVKAARRARLWEGASDSSIAGAVVSGARLQTRWTAVLRTCNKTIHKRPARTVACCRTCCHGAGECCKCKEEQQHRVAAPTSSCKLIEGAFKIMYVQNACVCTSGMAARPLQ